MTGVPAHPTHPPPTDVAIGLYSGAIAFAVLSVVGVFKITRGSALWRAATAHLLAMVTATVVFLVASIIGHGGDVEREVTGGALTLTLIALRGADARRLGG